MDECLGGVEDEDPDTGTSGLNTAIFFITAFYLYSIIVTLRLCGERDCSVPSREDVRALPFDLPPDRNREGALQCWLTYNL